MIQDCASSNKIKENKYKILRMSLLLGTDEDKTETINNFEDAAREIDNMNDEIYLKDLEDKFYDTLKLEDEEKKLAVLVDYIGGRVEQRISLLSDFANVTGFDLTNLPPIKYYDKLDDYKERLKYIREYLDNTKQINELNEQLSASEEKLKEAYLNKATEEECNSRNEEILLNKFEHLIKTLDFSKDITPDNIDSKLNSIIDSVQESKKSLDIFTKSFTTLSGSGISYEEEQEYLSYVTNAKDVYYSNKEQEYLLRIYNYLLIKEKDYSQILLKRESLNEILYERMDLRKQLQITDTDILSPLYDILERQYEDIKHQKDNIENIEILTESINNTKEQLNELEQDNQKVEILALLREFCIIDTYMDPTEPTSLEKNIPEVEQESSVTTTTDSPSIFESTKDTTTSTNQTLAPQSPQSQMTENALPNEVVLITNPTNIDLEFVHAKANKVMKRVGEMLGIKTEETKIVNVSNKPTPPEEPIPESIPTTPSKEENPLFNNEFPDFKESVSEEEKSTPEENNFWFPSDTPDALNELPDLEIANNNFFADNNMPDLNFPDLKINYDENNMEEER